MQRITKRVSLHDAYIKALKPGWFLVPKEAIVKKISENYEELVKNTSRYNAYILQKTRSNVPVAKKKPTSNSAQVQLMSALKELNFELGSSPEFFRIQMERAHAFLDAGHPVEFNMRAKQNKKKEAHPEMLNLILEHFPHLRPDFILQSMPEGTVYLVDPFVSGGHVKWAFVKKVHHTQGSMSKGILARKKKVAEAIEKGYASQLPKKMREKLIKAGHEEYSLDTGTTKKMAKPVRRMVPRWGAESLEPSPELRKEQREHKKKTRKQREAEQRKDEGFLRLIQEGISPEEAAKRFEKDVLEFPEEISKVKLKAYKEAIAEGLTTREASHRAVKAGKEYLEPSRRERSLRLLDMEKRVASDTAGSGDAFDELERAAQGSFLEVSRSQKGLEENKGFKRLRLGRHEIARPWKRAEEKRPQHKWGGRGSYKG